MVSPLDLERDGVHLGEPRAAVPLPDFNGDYDGYLAAHCTVDAPGRLVSMSTTTEDWPVWEIHPAGDEVVIIVRGRAEFIQDVDGTHHRCVVGANQVVINPAGVPHTANVLEPFTAIYITPCPGTHHVPRTSPAG